MVASCLPSSVVRWLYIDNDLHLVLYRTQTPAVVISGVRAIEMAFTAIDGDTGMPRHH